MQPHEERVVTEKTELDEKITKLGSFLGKADYSKLALRDRGLLQEQYRVMKEYSGILRARIYRFEK